MMNETEVRKAKAEIEKKLSRIAAQGIDWDTWNRECGRIDALSTVLGEKADSWMRFPFQEREL
jgi:hypothetical protein